MLKAEGNVHHPGCDTVVLHRNVRHQLSEPGGREVFSMLISVARTCHKQGIFSRVAVEATIRDPG